MFVIWVLYPFFECSGMKMITKSSFALKISSHKALRRVQPKSSLLSRTHTVNKSDRYKTENLFLTNSRVVVFVVVVKVLEKSWKSRSKRNLKFPLSRRRVYDAYLLEEIFSIYLFVGTVIGPGWPQRAYISTRSTWRIKPGRSHGVFARREMFAIKGGLKGRHPNPTEVERLGLIRDKSTVPKYRLLTNIIAAMTSIVFKWGSNDRVAVFGLRCCGAIPLR